MNNLKMIFTAVLFIALANLGLANSGIPAVSIQVSEDNNAEAINLKVEGQAKEILVIITDANQEQLLNEKISSDIDWAKNYRMDRLENGQYAMTVISDLKTIVQDFEVKNGKVSLSESNTYFAPYFRSNTATQELDINFFNPSREEVSVVIYDANDTVVFEKEIADALTIHERIEFKSVDNSNDDFTVVVRTKDQSYSYNAAW